MPKKAKVEDIDAVDSTENTSDEVLVTKPGGSIWEQVTPMTLPITILGLDPGTKNFAWNLIRVNKLTKKEEDIDLLGCGFLSTPKEFKRCVEQDPLRAVVIEINSILETLGQFPQLVAIERYHTRGAAPSGDIEQINLIIGAIVVTSNKPTTSFTPATWKTRLFENWHDNTTYTSNEWFPTIDTKNGTHRQDAGCIALYGYIQLVEWGLVEGVESL